MNKYVNKVQAILTLVGGDISAVNEDVTYLSGQTPPTDAEIDAEVARLQAEYDANQYQRDRQQEYPSIQECVHAILDDDLTAIQTKRKLIKDKYPKPE